MCMDGQAHGWMKLGARTRGKPHSTIDTGGPMMRGLVSVGAMFCTIMFGAREPAMCLGFQCVGFDRHSTEFG
jgi:hypothetical protein